jgi:hypothetical protein
MKNKTDWVAIGAALSIGYLMYVILTSDSLIFPAFIGAIVLQCVVSRTARHS